MGIERAIFGDWQGQAVEQFHLKSDAGVEVDIIGFGVVVRDWRVPVAGGLRSVVLGFDRFADYPEHSPHFGSLAGRVANRIKDASFTLDGQDYPLVANEGGLSLHGGPEGLGRQVWQGEADTARNAVRFTHKSPNGAMGYPGNVEFTATYTLDGHKLTLELQASTDRRTPISLVQHQYFNLGLTDTVLDHTIAVPSSAYTELGADLCPTGAVLPSHGTRYDLRAPRTMRDGSGAAIDYDINLVLDHGRDPDEPIAVVTGPDGALQLKLWSDKPGVQVYNGVWTDVDVPGLGGKPYRKHAGFCLEDQFWPDALHNPHFPSIIHGPDKPYRHWSAIEIAPLG